MTDPSQINQSINQQLPTNNRGSITAAVLRAALTTGMGAGALGLTGWAAVTFAGLNSNNTFTGINNFTGKVTFAPGTLGPVNTTAKCDGSDDTARITADLASKGTVYLPPFATCYVSGLVIADRQTLDGQMSVIEPFPGATRLITKTGFAANLRNIIPYDPTLVLQKTTTLTNSVAPNNNVLPVVSGSACQAGMIATVQLDSAAPLPIYWKSKVTSASVSSITIADNLPWTFKTAAFASAGSGYVTGEVVLNGITPTAGGAPATAAVTASAGALTGALTIHAPGLWKTNPGSTVSVYQPSTASTSTGGTATLTYGGAPNGGFVDCAWGAVVVDNADGGNINNVSIPLAPVGFQYANSSSSGSFTLQETLTNSFVNGATMVGVAKMTNVSNVQLNVGVNGFGNHTSPYGGAGVYIDGDGQTVASGGSEWNVVSLGFEDGVVDNSGTLDTFIRLTSDSLRDYAFLCFSCTYTDLSYAYAAFTGPSALGSLGSIGGQGGGVVFSGTAIGDSIAKLTTNNSAFDLHMGDQVSSVAINSKTWTWSTIFSGFSNSIVSSTKLFDLPTSATVSGSSTVYLTPGVVSTTEVNGVIAGQKGPLTDLYVTGSATPGGTTISAYLQISRYSAGSYGSWQTVAGCSWTGTATGCLYSGPGAQVLSKYDRLVLSLTPSGGSFPSGFTVSAIADAP